MGEQTTWRVTPRGVPLPPMNEAYLRSTYQTRHGAVVSAQRALDDLREQAIRDGLGDVVGELDGAREGESS